MSEINLNKDMNYEYDSDGYEDTPPLCSRDGIPIFANKSIPHHGKSKYDSVESESGYEDMPPLCPPIEDDPDDTNDKPDPEDDADDYEDMHPISFRTVYDTDSNSSNDESDSQESDDGYGDMPPLVRRNDHESDDCNSETKDKPLSTFTRKVNKSAPNRLLNLKILKKVVDFNLTICLMQIKWTQII